MRYALIRPPQPEALTEVQIPRASGVFSMRAPRVAAQVASSSPAVATVRCQPLALWTEVPEADEHEAAWDKAMAAREECIKTVPAPKQ